MSNPWMKFYPSDWRSDPALRMCSIAARGLWMEMLCLMHEATPCGSLVINGRPLSPRQISALSGASLPDTEAALAELEEAGVFGREPDGTIYSRRMRRDVEKAERDRANGKGGGNPNLKSKAKAGVNPPPNPPDGDADSLEVGWEDKAQKPDTRYQIPDKTPPLSVTAAPAKGGGGGMDLIDCVDRALAAYPKSKSHSQPKVLSAIQATPPADWPALVSGCAAYADEYRAKPTTHPIALDRFIRERLFDNYAPRASPASQVFVEIDTPEWRARVAAGHRASLKTTSTVGGRRVEGWHFPAPASPQRLAS